ncbi:hypothetical protein HV436_09995, partial [Bacillus sporothermodurans]|uniref:hypothetical protein n=1 Tax=Heyndrickxia sporothermodurans TaxID=46224 RepID=UPI00192CCB46
IYMRCLNGGLLVNYHYTRFGEVLLFLSLKPLDTQGLRIMKFILVIKLFHFQLMMVALLNWSFLFVSNQIKIIYWLE